MTQKVLSPTVRVTVEYRKPALPPPTPVRSDRASETVAASEICQQLGLELKVKELIDEDNSPLTKAGSRWYTAIHSKFWTVCHDRRVLCPIGFGHGKTVDEALRRGFESLSATVISDFVDLSLNPPSQIIHLPTIHVDFENFVFVHEFPESGVNRSFNERGS